MMGIRFLLSVRDNTRKNRWAQLLVRFLLALGLWGCVLSVPQMLSERTAPSPSPPTWKPTRSLTETSLPTPSPVPFAPLPPSQLWRGVVRIIALEDAGDTWRPLGWGSGTLVDPSGLILTNAHVVLDDDGNLVDHLLIQVTRHPERPPESCCLARVVQVEPWVDLAVLQITEDLQGHPLQDTVWPFVVLGDSLVLKLGDPILVYGYPGIGGDTITVTMGEIAGFTPELGYGLRAWIKTSTTMAGGNSGGLAADMQGRLIGVPTALGSGDPQAEYVDCRRLADTDRDGDIDEDDMCVPTGGFINRLRPVHLARPLLEGARLRSSPESDLPWAPLVRPVREIYWDDFNEPRWPIQQSQERATFYEQGEYVVHLRSPGFTSWYWENALETPDVRIALKARVVHPSADGEGEWGIVCRVEPEEGEVFYVFRVSEDGYFNVSLYYQGEWYGLVKWTPLSQEIPFNPKAGVELQAACVANQLLFWVNGHLVAYVQDFSSYEVGAGFFVATDEDGGNFIVAMDTLRIFQASLEAR